MKKIIFISLYIIQFFVGIGAAICGMAMIVLPSGTFLELPPDMLAGSPFNSFLIPGIILFLVNGVGQIVAGLLTIRRNPMAGYVGAVFGLGLMIWIFVQVNMIGGRNIIQYGYFFIGVIETALSFLIQDHFPGTSDERQ